MRLGFDLTLEQAQKLIMTPELRQAIQMLQFTSQELWQYVESQMEANPLLELENKREVEEHIEEYDNKLEDVDWKEYSEQYDDISYRSTVNRDEKENTFENYVSARTSLKDHLLFQLNLSIFDKRQKAIGEFIIECIDKNGYLNNPVTEISKQLNVEENLVENVIKLIQTFEPAGVCARDLKECLLIQLELKGINNPDIREIINNYLVDVAQNRLAKISKELNISLKSVQWICDLIKSLEPKPGRGFAHDSDEIKYITPDVYLYYIDGEYVISVNDSSTPRLIINNYYKQLLNKSNDDGTTNFLTERLNSAMWLIRSIEQRRMTIYKVVESILKYQIDFFEKGKKSLKPLTLKDVAEDIGVHESTVSRATNGKYIQTPRGLFELKYFFSSGISSNDGGISSTSIKSIIKEIIEGENPKKPLSDQQIVKILKAKDIDISRRTVAKYRDELGIASSSGRRRY
ncbi:RNA polymerase factor sigma-54 [Proteiniborus sp. MB09-C3]|uniref:RNA polymerase factor sigma-54 n=1 Tax=Proteiniborus sp. MB09-C3 TaxID=3050072 RepID=UPI002555204E|nr:RNA polymerase factor sigma-54 [Proteiniborus sp. MB09-C3]WIV10384.1 RNA polymerase factor sigma-54 [Proteiniborus sp. MB09-C3]